MGINRTSIVLSFLTYVKFYEIFKIDMVTEVLSIHYWIYDIISTPAMCITLVLFLWYSFFEISLFILVSIFLLVLW